MARIYVIEKASGLLAKSRCDKSWPAAFQEAKDRDVSHPQDAPYKAADQFSRR